MKSVFLNNIITLNATKYRVIRQFSSRIFFFCTLGPKARKQWIQSNYPKNVQGICVVSSLITRSTASIKFWQRNVQKNAPDWSLKKETDVFSIKLSLKKKKKPMQWLILAKNVYMKVDYSWKVQWTSYSSNLILSKFQSFAAIYGAMWLSHYIPLLRLFKLKLLRSPAKIYSPFINIVQKWFLLERSSFCSIIRHFLIKKW